VPVPVRSGLARRNAFDRCCVMNSLIQCHELMQFDFLARCAGMNLMKMPVSEFVGWRWLSHSSGMRVMKTF
jgi:hypothetical protein